MTRLHSRLSLFSVLLVATLIASHSFAAEPATGATTASQIAVQINDQISEQASIDKPFIDGYSPVSYFTKGIAERGSPEFTVEHDGKTYYLTSQDQVELFNENPDKYRPRHEYCSFSLSTGALKALDPTNFKVVGDNLLLFHLAKDVDGLTGWNNSPLTDAQLIERADKQFTLLKF